MDEPAQEIATRVGVVATDPLRVLGLKVIFSESALIEIVHLSVPGILDDATLALVLLDSDCTNHLFELMATFRQVRPQLRLIVLGHPTAPEYIQRVIGAGAKGYLSFVANDIEVRMAVDTVRDGSVWAPRKVLSNLLDRQSGTTTSSLIKRPGYTPREIQVLQLLRDGQSNREIAVALDIDESTVKAHIGRLMRKVGVSNRTALTIHPATQVGLNR